MNGMKIVALFGSLLLAGCASTAQPPDLCKIADPASGHARSVSADPFVASAARPEVPPTTGVGGNDTLFGNLGFLFACSPSIRGNVSRRRLRGLDMGLAPRGRRRIKRRLSKSSRR